MTYVFLHLSEYTSHISRHRFFYLNNIVCIVNIWLLVIVNFVKPYMYMLQILLDINNVIHNKSTTLISQENHLIETCQLFTIHVIKQTSNVGKKKICVTVPLIDHWLNCLFALCIWWRPLIMSDGPGVWIDSFYETLVKIVLTGIIHYITCVRV